MTQAQCEGSLWCLLNEGTAYKGAQINLSGGGLRGVESQEGCYSDYC